MKLISKDKRGWIKQFKANGKTYNLVFTKKGFYRAGDIHPNNQHDFIIDGRMRITERYGRSEYKFDVFSSDFFTVYQGAPHLFYALKDSLMLEWWNGKFSAKYYPPYRKIVEEDLKKGGKR